MLLVSIFAEKASCFLRQIGKQFLDQGMKKFRLSCCINNYIQTSVTKTIEREYYYENQLSISELLIWVSVLSH
jgi:hypothetical protein